MPRVFIGSEFMPQIFDGQLFVLFIDCTLDLADVYLPSSVLVAYMSMDEPGDVYVSSERNHKSEEWMPLEVISGNGLALLKAKDSKFAKRFEPDLFQPILWPPIREVASLSEVHAVILDALSQNIVRFARAMVPLQAALSESRKEIETLQDAMAVTLRSLGERRPLEPSFVMRIEPREESQRVYLGPGESNLKQRLSIPLSKISSVAIHVIDPALSAISSMEVRLLSAATGKIYGGWRIPGTSIGQGWLTLDLRAPLPPIAETAVLEICSRIGGDDELWLSLDPSEAEDALSLVVYGMDREIRSLCIRVLAAEMGTRYMLPAFWDWDRVGWWDRVTNVPLHLSSSIWHKAKTKGGSVDFVSFGSFGPVPVVKLGPGEEAVIYIAAVDVTLLGALELGVTPLEGAARDFQLTLTLIESKADDGDADNSAFQSPLLWKSGTLRDDRCFISATVTAGLQHKDILIGIRSLVSNQNLVVEISSLSGFKKEEIGFVEASAVTSMLPAAESYVSGSFEKNRQFGCSGIGIDHMFVSDDGSYRHIDFIVYDLQSLSNTWESVRLKFATVAGAPQIEFRQASGWPDVFDAWPDAMEDSFGRFFIVKESESEAQRLSAVLSEKDRALLSALFLNLPRLLELVLRHSNKSGQQEYDWLSPARRLQHLGFVLSGNAIGDSLKEIETQ
jgi:hypothetical protein